MGVLGNFLYFGLNYISYIISPFILIPQNHWYIATSFFPSVTER